MCFGYDLGLIKKSHTLSFYSFLQKFLLKKILAILFLVTVVSQFTAQKQIPKKLSNFCHLWLVQ